VGVSVVCERECVCAYVCVRKRTRDSEWAYELCVRESVSVLVCVRESARKSVWVCQLCVRVRVCACV